MKIKVEKAELENFLWYLQDKSDEVYEEETKKAVIRFLEDINKRG